MTDHIVLDLEIQKEVKDVGGWDRTDRMGVSVAVIYEYNEDRYRIYGDSMVDLLALRDRLKKAEKVTGFNIWSFDLPVIYGIRRSYWLDIKGDPPESVNDLFVRIKQARGEKSLKGWGLDAIVQNTLSVSKVGSGKDAPALYQDGRWVKLIDYCLQDVTVTRKLSEFMDERGLVNGPGGEVLTL